MITFTPTHGPAHEAWAAYDAASYDGPDSPRGTGQTRFEALAELVENAPHWLLHKLHSGREHSPPGWFDWITEMIDEELQDRNQPPQRAAA
jgi:hypothetical protein